MAGVLCVSQVALTRPNDRLPGARVLVGYAVRVSAGRLPRPLLNSPATLLHCQSGRYSVLVFADRGHVWRGREELKRISLRYHIEIGLNPWPAGTTGKVTVWDDGRVVRTWALLPER